MCRDEILIVRIGEAVALDWPEEDESVDAEHDSQHGEPPSTDYDTAADNPHRRRELVSAS